MIARLDRIAAGLTERAAGGPAHAADGARCSLTPTCGPARSATCTPAPDGSLMLVASDRMSAFDVILPTEIPDKGRVLTGLSRHWFATTGDIVRNHLISTETDDSGAARPDHDLPPDDGHPDRGGRPRLSRGIGLEGVPDERTRLRRRAPRGSRRERPAARADLHAGDQGRGRRARREHRLRDDGVDRRARRRRAGPRPRDRALPARRGRDGARRDPARGHQVRVRHRRGDAARSSSSTRR